MLLAALAQQLRVGDIDESCPLIPYAVRHGAWLYTKFAVGPDGKTAWESLRGKPFRSALAEFGEKVLYKLKLGSKMEKIKKRWDFGIFVGVRRRSNRGREERCL